MYSRKTVNKFLWGSTVVTVMLVMSACSKLEDPNDDLLREVSVEEMPGGQPHVLTADDVVNILKLGDFNEEQILELGVELRSAVMSYGGALVKKGGVTIIALSVVRDEIYLSLRGGNNIVIPVSAT